MGHRTARQHVNPLGLRFVQPRAQPIHVPAHLRPGCVVEVELGCADAQFSFALAEAHPERAVVGLDIREKVISANRRRAAARGLTNLQFGYVNLNVDLDRVFGPGSVDRFHLLFPDPWFKARHQKRRVVDLALCGVIQRQLRPGGEFHVATDIFDVALDAMSELESTEVERLGLSCLHEPWTFCRSNPYGARSKREDTTLGRGERVWRLRYGSGSPEDGSSSASSSDSQRA